MTKPANHKCGIDCGGGAWGIYEPKTSSKAYDFENGRYHIPLPDGPNFDNIIHRAKDFLHPKDEPDYSTPFAEKVLAITDEIAELLVTKNAAYGDSALNPIRVFSKGSVEDMLNVRADDKLSRIARGDGTGDEDAEMDLIGYLILKRVNRMEES